MKFAKKMKLVECREENTRAHPDKFEVTDSFFLQPKIIQNLDKSMSEILFNNKLADNQKWAFYNQALQRYLHFARQHNPQYTAKVKSPRDYTMFLNETQSAPNISHTFDISQPSMSSHNATRQSINSQHILDATRPSLDVSNHSYNTTLPTLPPSDGDETMYSLNETDLNTPVRNFFHSARTSNGHEFPVQQSTNVTQMEVIPDAFVRINDIGPVARNARSKRRAYHLDSTVPSPAARKKRRNRRGGSEDRSTQNMRAVPKQTGGLLKNWISFRTG